MYLKVLVPLGGSKNAERVLPLVEKVVAPGGEVILLRILPMYPPVTMGWPADCASLQAQQERATAIAYLEDVAESFSNPSIRCRYEIASAKSVADGIADFAARERVDLVAMYSGNRTGIAALVGHTVAENVRRKTPIEVKVFSAQEITESVPAGMPNGAAQEVKRRILRESDVFKGLTDPQIDKIAALAAVKRFPAGMGLGTAGDEGETLYILVQGDAQLSTPTSLGEMTVRIAAAGESFPLAALLGSGTLITSGKALTDVELLTISRLSLLDLLAREHEIGMRVYANVAHLFFSRYATTLQHFTAIEQRRLSDAKFLANV
jgi:CRP-like cAMP-binding protein/nucleotide-binding universal stress UspA family protein